MNIKFSTKVFGALAAAFLLSATSNAADCGKITIADMNWPSASLMAHALPVIAMVLLNNKLQLLMVKETGQIHHIFLLDALIPLKHL